MIKPTIGRRVWYWPAKDAVQGGFAYSDSAQPCDAGVAYVWHDRMVNLTVADQNGVIHSRCSVTLLQEGDTPPAGAAYAEWMPYQAAQAKAHAPTA